MAMCREVSKNLKLWVAGYIVAHIAIGAPGGANKLILLYSKGSS